MRGKQVPDATWDRPAEAIGLFLRGRTLRTAAPTALMFGAVLCVVNEGAVLISGQAMAGTWLKIGFNYIVSLIVASIGYLAARRAPRQHTTTKRPATSWKLKDDTKG
jgi:hypothetical protein